VPVKSRSEPANLRVRPAHQRDSRQTRSLIASSRLTFVVHWLSPMRGSCTLRGVSLEPERCASSTRLVFRRILHDLEERLARTRERAYAAAQRTQWDNILTYLDGLISGAKLVPAKEAPAYFEWTIWRAFLAINSLVNEPWECRKFEVYEGPHPYESFLPVGCARGGGPDLVFEFENFALVVEVTLTSSSRQEAAEGEPVRRHVAKFADSFSEKKKPVYGLFLSLSVDTNTAPSAATEHSTLRSSKLCFGTVWPRLTRPLLRGSVLSINASIDSLRPDCLPPQFKGEGLDDRRK
jgi:AlwI restriction endonuclease